MTTFSQLVDEVVMECRRPDMVADIATFLNQTLRELHFSERNKAILYKDGLNEVLLTATQESGFNWAIPSPETFQAMALVRYETLIQQGKRAYAPEKTPGIGLIGQTIFWYRVASTVCFSGYGGMGAQIALAYHSYTRRGKYYQAGGRPAEFDSDFGWTYAAPFDVDDESRAMARELVTNWLLMRWSDVIKEGVRAKVYKRLSDTERSRTSYSMFGALKEGLVSSESISGGFLL